MLYALDLSPNGRFLIPAEALGLTERDIEAFRTQSAGSRRTAFLAETAKTIADHLAGLEPKGSC